MAPAKKPPAKGLDKKVEADPGRTPAPIPADTQSVLQEPQAVPESVITAPAVHFDPLTPEQIASVEPVNPVSSTKVHFDETDVAFALARVTQDGKGEREPDPGDFKGFPAEGVIKED